MPGTSAAALRAIRTAIETHSFAPVYYLFGEEEYLKDEAARDLADAAVDPATRDFNLEVRRGGEFDAETLGSLLHTPPMMAIRRAVIVRDVNALKKNARIALDNYLERPSADVVLILTAPAGAKPDKVLEGRTHAVEFTPLTGKDLPKWISRYVKRAHDTDITPEASALLQDVVGPDLAQLKTELDKLASFNNGSTIDESAVSAVVGVRRGETLGSFLDAVAARDLSTALAQASVVLQLPKTSGVGIVMELTTQTIAIAWGKALRDSGVPAGRLEGEYWGLLKGNTYITGRTWKDAVRSWARAVDRWSNDQLDHALEQLLRADIALKESKISSDEQLLANLVLAICYETQQRAA
jgi:DNA polymerase-3 subunit delta